MSIKVVKFGGTSMADAKSIRQVAEIIKQDKERRYVVVSAPGKRFSQDHKVTDMLYACYHDMQINGECKATFDKIRERFKGIVKDLGLGLDIDSYLDKVEEEMLKYNSAEFCASRGEYLSAVITAEVLGYEFIDAKDVMIFDANGDFDSESTNEKVKSVLENVERAVVPGFYGGDSEGIVHTFSRGGSDVSGAVIARAVGASLYENWTDVNGFMSADPRIVDNPKPIETLSYKELRELAYMGANVLHPESIFPVRVSKIPINIRNTFCPTAEGTMIVAELDEKELSKRVITGIAGKKGYSIIYIEKSMMNSELGFVRKVLAVLEYYNISIEHLPTGIDTMSIVIPDNELAGKEDVVIERIKKVVDPDHIEIKSGISLIATVGHGMSYKPGSASTLVGALAKEKINIRMIDQGSSEMNIIVGIATSDYERAIKAIYAAFQK
ncbi:MAG: aspartate kinase [Clostridia bacterium]|jgi:aspartate kinase|nr:aspartate kinase [Clostridia bacterium]MCI8944426.1 aspartate kinase [Clostridia bacterium]MCI9291678.1 aspartate kinase [Clostridia bacterium]